MPKRSRLLLTGLVWVAFFFRLHSLFHNRFQLDEALFSSWARHIAVWRDPLLKMQAVDKPPLLFYLQSVFFPPFGPVEWAARLPNFVASLLLIPLISILVWVNYQDSLTALFAGGLIALSPLAIQFSSTAFTDPLMTFLVTGAVLLLINRTNPMSSGLFFGLAVAAKYQAWLFLPLLAAIGWLENWNWKQTSRWLLGLLSVLLPLVIWEILNGGEDLLFSRQIDNFGGLRLMWSWELSARFSLWAQLWHLSLGSWLMVTIFVVCTAYLIYRAFQTQDHSAKMDLVLILFVAGYLVLHWLIAVPVWDRYLLPILPFVLIITARGVVALVKWLLEALQNSPFTYLLSVKGKNIALITLYMIFLLLSLPGASIARAGQWPLGGQPGADQGAWQIAQFLENESYGTVLYDHWYSWQWRYHLFDKKVFVSWFPDTAALIEDLEVFADSPGRRYLVLPNTKSALPVLRTLDSAQFQLIQVLETDANPGMVLYLLQPKGDAE